MSTSDHVLHNAYETSHYSYLNIYAVLLIFVVSMYALGYGNYIYGSLRASRKIHRELVQSVLGTTLR